MPPINPSALLAESLSTFSKAAYQAFAEFETQSRLEVAQLSAEIREAKLERDKAVKDLHTIQLETQSWKQEIAAAKASLSQAEMTIAHQTDTIAQLRREVAQWKDQSQNWQEHFTRVEQERCAQLSRINELVDEKLQYPQQRTASTSIVTPKSTKYINGVNSAPSSISKRNADTPPQHPSSVPSKSSEQDTMFTNSRREIGATTPKRVKNTSKSSKQTAQREQVIPPPPEAYEGGAPEPGASNKKRPRKEHPTTQRRSTSKQADPKQTEQPPPPATVRSSTVIRRVHTVVHVKREDESSDESAEMPPQISSSSSSGGAIKKKEESIEHQRHLRTPRRAVPNEDEEDEIADGLSSSPLSGQPNGHDSSQRGRLRLRKRIDYAEDDEEYIDEDEDEDDVDELLMGAEDNHDEVYGTHRVDTYESQWPKKHPKPIVEVPPFKKRKVAVR